MKGCDHDVVYSGQTNLEQKFAYICRKCGEIGWDSRYVMACVNFDEYCRQRVIHGWASPSPIAYPGGAWRLVQQNRIAEIRRTVQRSWRFPLVTSSVAFLMAAAACLLVRPTSLPALGALPILAVLIGVSWWKVKRG